MLVQRDWLARAHAWYVNIASFRSSCGKVARSLLTYLLTGRLTSLTLPYSSLPSYLTPFLPTLLYSLLLYYWDKIYLTSLPSFFRQKNSKIIPNCVLTKFRSSLIENVLIKFQLMYLPNSNWLSLKIFWDKSKLFRSRIPSSLLTHSILLPLESN